MALDLWVDIENSAGQRLGNGPITSASQWRYTSRMDKAGAFEFKMPAGDAKALTVQKKRIARAYALLNGQRVEVGAGIIDRIIKEPQADGTVLLSVSGDDLVRELTYRSVLNLKLYLGGNPVSHAAAVSAVSAYAPVGWSFTPDGSPSNDSIYGYFNGETVLAAMIKIGQKSQNHFYRGTGRSLVFASSFTPSGVRAIQARGQLSAATCAIVALTEQTNTYDLITRIYPRGSGNANAQLTLRATNRSAPTGYTLNAAQNYIEHDASVATYGIIERQVDFRDIGPVDNTDADIQAASNMLFDAALETLTRQSTELEQATYTVKLAGCSQLLRPMQSIRVVYQDAAASLNVDSVLNILEATWQVDTTGIYTTDLIVSNADRWPPTGIGAIVDSISQGQVYQALPQLNANSYVTAYNKNVDDANIAAFRFRFGNEVTQLQQVLFEFQILPFESTVQAVGGASSGSGDIPTSGPNTNETGGGGNNETGSGGPTTTDSSTPTLGSATPAVGATTPTIGGTDLTSAAQALATDGAAPAISLASPAIGSSTPVIGVTTPTIDAATPAIGTTTPVIGTQGLTTNTPTGGSTDGSGDHQHFINVIAGSGSLGAVSLHESGGLYFLANPFVTGSEPVYVSPVGFHTHTVNAHAHTIDPHSHALPGHTHSLPSHTHGMSGHTHGLPAHSHSLPSHTHGIALHTHTIAGHSHTIALHTHTIASHTHTIAAHTHTITAHTHSMSSHTHSLNNHTHDLSESITAIYGIFRESAPNTYVLADLDYQVNSGGWHNMEDDAVSAGDGWYQLDITSLVMNATTFRPNQSNNVLEIRSLTADKTATIDAQLSVRNIIQAVAYA